MAQGGDTPDLVQRRNHSFEQRLEQAPAAVLVVRYPAPVADTVVNTDLREFYGERSALRIIFTECRNILLSSRKNVFTRGAEDV